ncbi:MULTISPECIES: twin-arginine translocation pathway signal protein [unclassified Roseitalea]|uniref:Acg family FMN-binding oxidoreductase n=1 Tax=unclassified Roseitalea TaxID=2639107 RepID=UPI00273FE0F6|nr:MULTISPECIES: twin-arginine translocation pathway signal protein [unclassified Roseitalea]
MPSLSRRKVLMLAGGGIVVAAGASATAFALTRTPRRALEPWERAGAPGYEDPRMRALSFAILAPNPHNRQPWTVELVGDDGVSIGFDQSRQLPHTDPFDRQLTVGMGCFLELMVMAAAQDGYRVDLDLFPQGASPDGLTDAPVALARFVPDKGVKPDPLFAHVLARRSAKEAHDMARPVPAEALEAMLTARRHVTAAGGTVDAADLPYWRELSRKALAIEFETPRTYRESVDLFRIGKREINANPDGIELPGAPLEILKALGLFTRETALDPGSIAYRQGMAAVMAPLDTSMGFVWTVTETNDRLAQIGAGRDWVRMNLAATAAGIAFHPLSQCLQEYEEMDELYEQVHQRLAPDGGTVQMLARIGYGPAVGPTPRWPLESRIVERTAS